MLTQQQVKTLAIVGVVKYIPQILGRKVPSERSDLFIFNSRCAIGTATLFKHLVYFLKRTRKYIKKHESRNKYDSAKHINVIRGLWKLMRNQLIEEKSKSPSTPATKKKLTSLQKLKLLRMKNLSKLERIVKKRADWLQQVSNWRQSHINHPDYHSNHPEEQKFLKLKSEIKKKIETLKMNHERYMEKIGIEVAKLE